MATDAPPAAGGAGAAMDAKIRVVCYVRASQYTLGGFQPFLSTADRARTGTDRFCLQVAESSWPVGSGPE